MRRKERPKYAKRFWTRRLFNDVVQHGHNRLREWQVEDGSGFRKFARMTKGDFEILLQKIGPRIQRKDTKYRWRHSLLGCYNLFMLSPERTFEIGDFFDFNSADFLFFCKKIIALHFLFRFLESAQCTCHKHALDCKSSIKVTTLSFDHILTAQILQGNWHIEGSRCTRTRSDLQTLSVGFHPSRETTDTVRVRIICLRTVRGHTM
jgi:hypothetical protein